MTILDMEIALMYSFGVRTNLILPNASWGLGLHECDLLIIRKSGCAVEVEIKTDKYDLINDKKKRHGHRSNKIKQLYFAIPTELMPYIEHIPERAGIIEVAEKKYGGYYCIYHRKAKINSKYKFTDKEIMKAGHLGCMRILGLKEIINQHIKKTSK